MSRFWSGLLFFSLLISTTARADDVGEFAEQLQSSKLDERREAAYALADLGPSAEPALDALREALEDDDTQVWTQAMVAISRIGRDAEAATDDLIELLDSRSEQRRYRAAHTLGQIGPPAIQPLIEQLDSKSSARSAAAEALGWIGSDAHEAIEPIAELLQDQSEEVRHAAAVALGRIGDRATAKLLHVVRFGTVRFGTTQDDDRQNGDAPPSDAFDSDDEPARIAAVQGLIYRQQAVPEALPVLEFAYDKGSAELTRNVVTAMGVTGFESPTVIPTLLRAIAHNDESVQRAAVESLLRLTPTIQSKAAKYLAHLLSDASPEVTKSIALVIGGYGNRASSAVPELLRKLAANPDARDVAWSLGKIGEPAVQSTFDALRTNQIDARLAGDIVEAMPPQVKVSLAESLDDPSGLVRQIAVMTIGRLLPPPPDARERLIAALRDEAAGVRAQAAHSLAELGQTGEPVVAALEQAVGDPAAKVRAAAVTALGRLHSNPNQLADTLGQRLGDESVNVRVACLQELSKLEILPSNQFDDLSELLRSDHSAQVRGLAATAIARLDDVATDKTAMVLLTGLRDESIEVRKRSLLSLSSLDNLPSQAVEAVVQQLESDESMIRVAAIEAIAGIGREASAAWPQIADLSGDADSNIRKTVIKSVRHIAPSHAELLPLLIDRLEDEDWAVRESSAEELAELEEDAAPAIPALLELLRRDNDSLAARQAINEIKTASVDAIPTITSILEDESSGWQARRYALFVLREMGNEAAPALPILKQLRDDANGRARESLDKAIREIEE